MDAEGRSLQPYPADPEIDWLGIVFFLVRFSAESMAHSGSLRPVGFGEKSQGTEGGDGDRKC